MWCDVERIDFCSSDCVDGKNCLCTSHLFNATLIYDTDKVTLTDGSPYYFQYSVDRQHGYCQQEEEIRLTCGYCDTTIWIDTSNALCSFGSQTSCHCKYCHCKYCISSWFCCYRYYCSCKAIETRTTTAETQQKTTSTTPTTTRTMHATSKGDSSSPIGGAVGGSIAALFIAMLLVALFIWVRRKRVNTRKERNKDSNAGVFNNNRNYDSNQLPNLTVPPPTYDDANVHLQNDGTATYQVSKSDTKLPCIDRPSQATENQTDNNGGEYELANPIALESDENYFVLEPEDGIFQIQKGICDNDKTFDKNEYVNSDTITGYSDGNEDLFVCSGLNVRSTAKVIYGRCHGCMTRVLCVVSVSGLLLNEEGSKGRDHAENDEYQHIKHKGGAREEYESEDYDHLKTHPGKTEYDPNDDYDHCKSVAPEQLSQGREGSSVDDSYDHL